MLKRVIRASVGWLGYAVVRKTLPGEFDRLREELAGCQQEAGRREVDLAGYKNAFDELSRDLAGYKNACDELSRDLAGYKNACDELHRKLGETRQALPPPPDPVADAAARRVLEGYKSAVDSLRGELAAARGELERLRSGTPAGAPPAVAAVSPLPEGVEVVVTDPRPRQPERADPPAGGFYRPVFDCDGLRNDPAVIHNHDFMADPRFARAYARGIRAQGEDQKYYWRMYVGLWCAAHAAKLPGDFVECGVWKGFLSSAIMDYLDWNSFGRTFYLFDTFNGIDEALVTEEERVRLHLDHYRMHYTDNWEQAKGNFAEFRNVVLVKGSVPTSLGAVAVGPIAYLSIDMNNVTPELAAADYFWDRLVPGGVLLLDDYGFVSYEEQKKGFDRFAAGKGLQVLALPTGQGLIVKPT